MSERRELLFDHEFPWPDFGWVFDPENLEDVTQAIVRNYKWNATEKIDGLFVIISSEGWMSTNYKKYDYNSIPVNYGGATKRDFQNSIDKMKLMRRCFIKTYENQNVDFMAYGKIITAGISTSTHDIYDYQKRGFKVGDILFFGIGIVLRGEANTNESYLKMKAVSKNIFLEICVFESPLSDKRYIIVPINLQVRFLLDDYYLKSVPDFGYDSLKSLLLNPRVTDLIKDRKVRGIVLSRNGKEMKLNYLPGVNIFLDSYFIQLEDNLQILGTTTSSWIEVFDCLKKIYKSSNKFVSCFDIKEDFDIYITASLSKYPEIQAVLESLEHVPEERKLKIVDYSTKIMTDIKQELRFKFDKQIEFAMDPLLNARFHKRVTKAVKGKKKL